MNNLMSQYIMSQCIVAVLIVTQGAFAVACFLGWSDICECLSGFQMALPTLEKQTADCKSQYS